MGNMMGFISPCSGNKWNFGQSKFSDTKRPHKSGWYPPLKRNFEEGSVIRPAISLVFFRWSFWGNMFFRWWFQIFCSFHPYLGTWSNLTNMFQLGWNHQIVFLKTKETQRWRCHFVCFFPRLFQQHIFGTTPRKKPLHRDHEDMSFHSWRTGDCLHCALGVCWLLGLHLRPIWFLFTKHSNHPRRTSPSLQWKNVSMWWER